MTAYAELQVTTNFSFLEGASSPEELVRQAIALGLSALAITDRNSLAGVVRAYTEARDRDLKIIVGARLDLRDGPSVLCLPENRAAYGRLSRLITKGRRRIEKGECELYWGDLLDSLEGQQIILLPPERLDQAFADRVADLKQRCGGALSLAATCRLDGQDHTRLSALAAFAKAHDVAMVACNDVLYHVPERRVLQDVLTCIRHGCTIDEAGFRLQPNAERYLKSPAVMTRLFSRYPEAIERTIEIAGRCRFCLSELRYEYPTETRGDSASPQEELVRLTWENAREKFPNGIPDKVRKLVEYELKLIGELEYAPYFLTVYDIVRFAKSRGILCQGRGSAANSTVCFCLGITSVDPEKIDVLFERFVSAERREPPDIDVDFEHQRREEVIQYIYEKYTRDRAGLTATVIHYQPKSAIRDVGKALGLSLDTITRLSKTLWGWGRDGIKEEQIREIGIDPDADRIALTIGLARALVGFPRHLSQHVGGFVISRGPLDELVPIENAAMDDRTVIQWDKDDIAALGIMKVDVLALGMLTCIRKAFDLIERHEGKRYTLATIPQDDPEVYALLSRADTIGVFQVESRAQMSMLPRLRPKVFYDLVIQVAIVRPGPIQGDMVHPYLRRRNGEEDVNYVKPELEAVLKKTLGVPLFQEQAMRIAIVAAGFTPAESDRLRRAMATFRRVGTIGYFEDKLIEGMVKNGYPRDFAERCFNQIRGFGEYGFPESHAAAFAHLAYISAWIKCHHPAVFAAALLNSQPMGFYAPAQIVRDAREHHVEVRPVDVNHSDWDCTLERTPSRRLALRLGFRQVKGCRQDIIDRLVEMRGDGYATLRDLWRRTALPLHHLEVIARADACASLGLNRRQALWHIRALGEKPLPLFEQADALAQPGDNQPPIESGNEPEVALPPLTMGEQVLQDYREISLTLRQHPLALLRPKLAGEGFVKTRDLRSMKEHQKVKLAGLVLIRQRPGTASGVIFVTIEDETGIANLIVWPKVTECYRRALLGSRLLAVEGKLQFQELPKNQTDLSPDDRVMHVIADRLIDRSDMLTTLGDLPDPELFDHTAAQGDELRVSLPPPLSMREVQVVIPDARNFK
ncbi:error-prone DNA polymerase [uncultured Ferrovibrio sp.]|jgi:error-prone DNA polymerase|uniref:error-prone DNA polymerase n=1 Tax=uncultured Ferrovibrio sp. TaxID=1576913 RepID=UPI00262A1B39|nr:error-prone DNA polymerase [uncultured Ferrovibrio sp.]